MCVKGGEEVVRWVGLGWASHSSHELTVEWEEASWWAMCAHAQAVEPEEAWPRRFLGARYSDLVVQLTQPMRKIHPTT